MQILYLYIKDFNGIIEQGFNFGGEFLFHYDTTRKNLDVKLNPFYIKGFYNGVLHEDDVDILNVSAIIAGNGAGKTTILNFLRNNFAAGSGGVGESMLLVFEDRGEKKIYHFDDIEVKNNDLASYGFEIKKISPQKRKIESEKSNMRDLIYSIPPRIYDFEKTDFIFFSNIFDGYYNTELKGVYDISTNYLIRHDLIVDVENKRISGDTVHSEIQSFLKQDIRRQIDLINGFRNKNLVPFQLPELLSVQTSREYDEYLNCFDSNDIQILEEFNISSLVKEIFNTASYQSSTTKDWKKKAEIYFIKACIVNYLYELATNYRSIGTHVRFEFSKFNIENNNLLDSLVALLGNIEMQTENFENVITPKFYKKLSGIKNFIQKISGYISSELVETANGTRFGINIQKKPDDFLKFYDLYTDSYDFKPYLNFSWRQLSTGENALLNIFSRFHDVATRQRKLQENKLSNSMIILIDEGEAYLHPSWQKKFLKMLLDFLPIVFKTNAKRTIQIIFSTNSAIPASDLPNSNIIFLEKNNEKIVVLNSLEDKKKTFGANINTLLADSFFLRDGTIGDFAKSKINHIIELLQDNHEVIISNKEYLEKAINLIGEPLIRNKLIQMLTDRLSLNLIGMNDRIEILEKELKELKKNQ